MYSLTQKFWSWCMSALLPFTVLYPVPRPPVPRNRQMLTDLGVSPASISEKNAASIFDDVVRNGLPDVAERFATLKLHQSRQDGSDGGDDFMTTGGHGRGHSSSREPRGYRLCWSLFLEAMVSACVDSDNGHLRHLGDQECFSMCMVCRCHQIDRCWVQARAASPCAEEMVESTKRCCGMFKKNTRVIYISLVNQEGMPRTKRVVLTF